MCAYSMFVSDTQYVYPTQLIKMFAMRTKLFFLYILIPNSASVLLST